MSCPHPERADARPELVVSACNLSSAESPSEEIVSVLVEYVETDPDELQPLSRYVDPDALDALFGGNSAEPRTEITLSFRYEGHLVTVDTAGVIQIYRQKDIYGGGFE